MVTYQDPNFNSRNRDINSNLSNERNFLIKLFWLCSGAEIDVLKKAPADQNKYASIGFSILLIGLLAAISGGYALWTVFDNLLISYLGGGLWGLILGTMDRFVVSSVRKSEEPDITEKVGGTVFFLLRLSISILISFVVAKPLELKMFEKSIDTELGVIREEKINEFKKQINPDFEVRINYLKEQKEARENELNDVRTKIAEKENERTQEARGELGTPPGAGKIYDQLTKTITRYQNEKIELTNKIQQIEQNIETEESSRNIKIKEQEKKLNNAKDFVARLSALHSLQKKEENIIELKILGITILPSMGVYEVTGWVISLVFILIDTTAIIIKIFTPKSVYDRMLELNTKEQIIFQEERLKREYNLERIRYKLKDDLQEEQYKKDSENLSKVQLELKNKKLQIQLNKQDKELELQGQEVHEIEIKIQNNNDLLEIEKELNDLAKKIFLKKINKKKEEIDRDKPEQESHYNEEIIDFRKEINVTYERLRDNANVIRSKKRIPRIQKKKIDKISIDKFKKISRILTPITIGLSPIIIWIISEAIIVYKIKIDPMPLPSGMNRNLIYSKNGQLLRNPYQPNLELNENQVLLGLELSEFSKDLQHALIASEDRRFYQHNGFDTKGFIRACLQILKGNKQGGSTISQQLAKKLFIERRFNLNKPLPLLPRTIRRFRIKLQQIILALRIEQYYEKDEILRIYLNRTYLGNKQYNNRKELDKEVINGFEEAAQFYFDKSAKNLNIIESATLVSMLPSPNRYNPIKNLKKVKILANLRIDQMLELKYITEEQAKKAKKSDIPIKAKQYKENYTVAPHFYNVVNNELKTILELEEVKEKAKSGEYIIQTTLDWNYQKLAEEALQKHIENKSSQHDYNQGALITLDDTNGAILALVGGENFKKSQFDRASIAKLPLASTFKLFTYTAAIEEDISPNKTFSCEDWIGAGNRIQCHSKEKDLTIKESLAKSENPPTLRIAQEVGLPKIEQLATEMNMKMEKEIEEAKKNKSSDVYFEQLVLGTVPSTLLRITNAYSTISNRGKLNTPYTIKTIRDRNDCEDKGKINSCTIIYSARNNLNQERVVTSSVADKVKEMLRGVVTDGTAKTIERTSSEFITKSNTFGKTGTSKNSEVLWFIGVVPEENITTGVLIEQKCLDDPKTQTICKKKANSSLAVELWAEYMKEIIDFE